MADFDPDSLLDRPPPATASMKVRPKREYTREEARNILRQVNPDITKGAIEGELDNIQRESGFKTVNPGDYSKEKGRYTSDGAYQHHASRLTEGQAWAKQHGMDWQDFKTQAMFARMEKERDYPALLKLQQTSEDRGRNEDAFKRIFERPASVLWQHNANGEPVLGNDRYQYSDYAMKEHAGRPDTDLHYMSPEEYLALAPKLIEKPFESPSGRALLKSIDKGDKVEAVPTLDVNVDGPTATVTDQDGRHRALLAQQEGLQAIPVAIRRSGEGDPKEIVGMDGLPQAFDHPKVGDMQRPAAGTMAQPAQPKQPLSLIGSAEAAEPTRDAAGNPVDAQAVPEWMRGAQPVQQAAPAAGASPAVPEWMSGAQPVQQSGGGKPVAQMSQEEAQAANLDPQQQREWIEAQNKTPLVPEMAAAAGRGLAPYAAGAAAGAAMGAPFAGVGAIPGAIAGAGAVGLTQLATNVAGMRSPKDMTDAALDALGVRRPDSALGRITEHSVEGVGNALSGAGAMGQLAKYLTSPLSKAVVGVLAERRGMQAVSGAASGAGAQLAAEAGLSPWMQQVAGLVTGLIPSAVPGKAGGLFPNFWRTNASDAAKKAIESGFVLHPADAGEGHIGKMNFSNAAAADAGKIKTGQMASAINQPRVNLKVQQELGLPPGTTLYDDVLQGVRRREAGTYKELYDVVPEVQLGADPIFRGEISKIGDRLKKLVEQFPYIKTLPDGVGAQIENFQTDLLKQAGGETRTVMDYLGELRRQASHNINRPNNAISARLGLAQREAAMEIEAALGRSIERAPDFFRQKLAQEQQFRTDAVRERVEQGLPLQGGIIDQIDARIQDLSDRMALANSRDQNNTTLLDRWRKARKTIAQTHDIEAVTNPASGDVSAIGLFNLMNKGRPLSGALKDIAEAAGNFRRSFQNPAAFGGVEPLSILDVGFSAAHAVKAAASGSVANLLGALAPWIRHPIRAAVTSDARQRAMIAPHQAPAVAGSALTTPLLSTQPTGNALLNMQQGNQ